MNYKYKYLKYKNKYLNTKKNITRGGSTNSTLANDDEDFSTYKSPPETWQTKEREKNIIKINYKINLDDYYIYIDRTFKIETLKNEIINNDKDIFKIKNLFKIANNQNEILKSVNFDNLYTNLYKNIIIKHGETILDNNSSIESTGIEYDATIIILDYYKQITLILREIIHRIYMYNRSKYFPRNKLFYTKFPYFLINNDKYFTDGEKTEYFIRKKNIMEILKIINLICKILYTLKYNEDFLYLKIKHIVEYYSPWDTIENVKKHSAVGTDIYDVPAGKQHIAEFSQKYLDTRPNFKNFYMSLEVDTNIIDEIGNVYENMKQFPDLNNSTSEEIIKKFKEENKTFSLTEDILKKIVDTILTNTNIISEEDLLKEIFSFINKRDYWFINEYELDNDEHLSLLQENNDLISFIIILKSKFRTHIINNYSKT